MKKNCIICGKEFITKVKNQVVCSEECRKIHKQKNSIEYYYKNKEIVRNKTKKYYFKHKEEKRKMRQCKYCGNDFKVTKEHIFYCSNECHEKMRKITKNQWLKNNKQSHKESIRKCRKNKYNSDINFKMQIWSRKQIKRCLKDNKKQQKTTKILGYTTNQLKQRLESQFKSDMNWSNHGTLWHIDHKKPISLFNFELPNGEIDYEQVKIANSLQNLQPLLANENLSKGGKY